MYYGALDYLMKNAELQKTKDSKGSTENGEEFILALIFLHIQF